jgi:hypothetical protein
MVSDISMKPAIQWQRIPVRIINFNFLLFFNWYRRKNLFNKNTKNQTQSTPRLFFCSLCFRVCSLSGSHNQMRLTVRNETNCCCLTCVRAIERATLLLNKTLQKISWLTGIAKNTYPCKIIKVSGKSLQSWDVTKT